MSEDHSIRNILDIFYFCSSHKYDLDNWAEFVVDMLSGIEYSTSEDKKNQCCNMQIRFAQKKELECRYLCAENQEFKMKRKAILNYLMSFTLGTFVINVNKLF